MADRKKNAFRPQLGPRPNPLQNLVRLQHTYFFTPDLEKEICRLDGVTAARVLTLGTEVDEIHVATRPDRPPKKVVRDIESLLLLRFGLRIDHRKISIVHLDRLPGAAAEPGRLQIQKVTRVPAGEGIEVSVEVSVGESTITASGRARAGETELHGAVRAVINAIEQILGSQGLLELQAVEALALQDHRITVVILGMRREEQSEVLVGTGVVRGESIEAAARATLDALNRKLVRAYPAKPPAP